MLIGINDHLEIRVIRQNDIIEAGGKGFRFYKQHGPVFTNHTGIRDIVLIAGDAAHLNNPVGGMGMNGGVQDAYNVADKLVAILNEGEDVAVLERYTRQRREIAIEYVNAQTARNKKTLEERDPEVRRKHYDDLRAIAKDKKRTRELLLQTTMINAVRRADAIE